MDGSIYANEIYNYTDRDCMPDKGCIAGDAETWVTEHMLYKQSPLRLRRARIARKRA